MSDPIDPIDPVTEDVLAVEPEPEPATPRYAVYDNTLLRFTSGVVDTVEEAEELALLAPETHDVEVREV